MFVCMYGGGGGKKRESRSNPNEYCSTGRKTKTKKHLGTKKTNTTISTGNLFFGTGFFWGEAF